MNKAIKLTNSIFLTAALLFSQISFATIPHVSIIPKAPQVNAKSYVLLDYYSGKVLTELNSKERLEPASLTKVMTVYVIDKELQSGRLHMDDMVQVSRRAWKTQGSRMFIEPSKKVKVQDLLKGVIVQSGNDASVALAEHVAGSEENFATLMNEYAKLIGMKDSHFMNPTGLPHPDHYTTAHDMAVLASHIISEFPESYDVYSMKSFKYNNILQNNRNRLLWRDPRIDGIKTGHTQSAGYCLVASAKNDESRFIAVLMGAKNDQARNNYTYALLRYAMRYFKTHKLYEKAKPITKQRVWLGEKKELEVGVLDDLYITILDGQYEKLNAAIDINQQIEAPIKKGDELGKITVKIDDESLIERKIVALEDVNEANLFSKIADHANLLARKLFTFKTSK